MILGHIILKSATGRESGTDCLFVDKCLGYSKFGRKKPLDGTFHQTDAIPEFEKAMLHNVLKFCMEAAILVTSLSMLSDQAQ